MRQKSFFRGSNANATIKKIKLPEDGLGEIEITSMHRRRWKTLFDHGPLKTDHYVLWIYWISVSSGHIIIIYNIEHFLVNEWCFFSKKGKSNRRILLWSIWLALYFRPFFIQSILEIDVCNKLRFRNYLFNLASAALSMRRSRYSRRPFLDSVLGLWTGQDNEVLYGP